MKSGLLLSLSAAAAILAATARAAENSPRAHAAPDALIVRGDRLFIEAEINGERVLALLDSGAEISILDKEFAAKLGLSGSGEETARGTGGETKAAFAEHVKIAAAGLTLPDQTVAIIDLKDIARRVVKSPVPAIIGRDLFDAARLRIDIAKGEIAAVSRDREPEGVKLALETQAGIETIPVSIEGGDPVRADFDLGNGGDMLIGAAYAAKAGLSAPERIIGRKSGGGLGGELSRDLVMLRSVKFAGAEFHDIQAAIDPTSSAADANIGVRLLRRFLITADFEQHAVWLRPDDDL
ncbi:MAG: hypothetical protein GC153_11620 [Alphaproteobacteria bacterium]|nr:hypothetical protein [Alphaproteobacteria bacterium]